MSIYRPRDQWVGGGGDGWGASQWRAGLRWKGRWLQCQSRRSGGHKDKDRVEDEDATDGQGWHGTTLEG